MQNALKLEDVEITQPELAIQKKLGSIGMSKVFDIKTLQQAENIVTDSTDIFREETLRDFNQLQQRFESVDKVSVTVRDYSRISETAFSLKSRAKTGGFPLVSDIANILYQYCDKAAETRPAQGYKVLEMHFNAIREVIEGKFDATNGEKTSKLIGGLNQIARKFA